jgi:hypothetical protein
MRPRLILPLIATLGALTAQTPAPHEVAAEVAAVARQEALEKILSERESPAAFEKALAAARDAGVSEQAMLEARFLYHVDLGKDDAIAALLPDFLKHRANFKLADSAIFSVEEDWLAVIEYLQAVAALGKGDKDAFKRHITEAFWLSPGQAAAFAPHIERLRMEQSMALVEIDFALEATPLDGGQPVALSNFMHDNKAMLLHFWSPWSRECAEAMDDFSATAAILSANGIAVVSLLPPGVPALAADAREMLQRQHGKTAGAWLVDPENGSLARLLRVRRLPTMVIVSDAGKVLFNGDPSDELLWRTLRGIDARITRPQSMGAERD